MFMTCKQTISFFFFSESYYADSNYPKWKQIITYVEMLLSLFKSFQRD